MRAVRYAVAASTALALMVSWGSVAQADDTAARPAGGGSFLGSLTALPSITADVTGANGDANPYGVAIVPSGFPSGGAIHAGDMLVSNFNNGAGLQGAGTTIIAITPGGATSAFFTAPENLAPVGLSTALIVLKMGIVVVGSTPTIDGTPATVSDGSLIFLDRTGHVLLNLTDDAVLQGPWDMTVDDSNPHQPVLFVSDVLNGAVTEVDLAINTPHGVPMPVVRRMTQIATGFTHRTDPAALLVGPTGLLITGASGVGSNRVVSLDLADTGADSIVSFTCREQGGRAIGLHTIVSGAPLEGPLALAAAPNGDILTSNGDAAGPPQTPQNINRVVEINPQTKRFVATRQFDSTGVPGAVFGIKTGRVNGKNSLIYVNDNSVTLNVFPVR